MDYRRLGNSGPLVSAIGVGTWVAGTGYGPVDEDELIRLIHAALDAGVTLFDTAPAYGRGQDVLGRALVGHRDQAVIVTKGGLVIENGRFVGRNSTTESLTRTIEDSLVRLRTDYVDLYLIHWPDRSRPIEEAIDGLERVRRSGKARFVGVSNFHATDLHEAIPRAPLVANQVAYNLFDRRWERQMFPSARELGVGIMAYSPLCHGLLSGHYAPDHQFSPGDWRTRGRTLATPGFFLPENFPTNAAVVARLTPIAARLGASVAALAIAWVLRDPLVAVAIIGARRVAQLDESIVAAGLTIPDDALAEIDAVMAGAAGLTDELPR